MNVNFGIKQSNITNVHRINQSIAARNSNSGSGQISKAERKDSVTISHQGKRNNLLENLMKQKANIIDQKNSLISSTLEKGGTLDTIKVQLENCDEQMKNVDDQIAEVMAKEMEKQTEKLKNQDDGKPKTEEEIQNERLIDITNLSSDLKQTQVICSVQARVDDGTRVLKSEIELDKTRAGSSPGAKEMIAKKEATLAEMQQKSLNLTAQISGKIADVVEKISDINKPQEIVPSEETENAAAEVNSADRQSPTDKPSTNVAENGNSEKISEKKV